MVRHAQGRENFARQANNAGWKGDINREGEMNRDSDSQGGENLDDELKREIEDALGEMSLSDLADLEAGKAPRGRGEARNVRRGKVIAIHGDDIFVDIGGRSDGLLPAEQFREEPLPKVGETVEVTVEGYDEENGLVLLSREGAVQAAAWETLEEGQLVEARVTGYNKGGLELTVGRIPAFMPISQIELFRVEELAPYVNQKLQCLVSEINRGEGSVIVSRRELLEAQAEEARRRLWETLAEGQTVRGVVRSIMPYGVFVDIGGVDGLLHVSDMSHGRVEDPAGVVREGQELEVMVLKVDRDRRRVSLGLKQIMADPWEGAEVKWPVDTIATGRVTRLAEFGAFVELAEGVEGLIPIGELSFERRVRHPREVVSAGELVKARVLSVDGERRRIGLSLKRAGDDPWVGASVRWPAGSVVEGRVTRLADFGAFVELAAGVEGLVHISELSEGRVRAVGDVVQEGDLVQAKVLSVDEERRRISLSVRHAADASAQRPAPDGPKSERKRKKPLRGGLD
ncbi:MAG: S1 RNA-binding domain-containing protein [Planctomycetota bacterium]|jgi:small subunit ribosomal protein S1